MYYTRRVGDIEEDFDGTPEEIIKLITELDKDKNVSGTKIITNAKVFSHKYTPGDPEVLRGGETNCQEN